MTPDEILDRVATNPSDPIAASEIRRWIATKPPTQHLLAFAEHCIGELAIAEPLLDDVLVREPENAAAWALLSLGHYLAAEYTLAQDAVNRAIEHDPVNERALDVQLSLLDPQQTPTAALTFAERMFEAHPMSLRALAYLAKARHLAGDPEGARNLLTRYLRSHGAVFPERQRQQLELLRVELNAPDLTAEETFSWP